MRTPILCLFLAGCLLVGCQRANIRQEALASEAKAYYQQAADLQRKVMVAMEHLEQERNQINVQGRALAAAERQRVADIEDLLTQYARFEDGFEPVATNRISQKEVERQRTSLERIRAVWERVQALE
ncbi:MAG TPA: hypothetical protein VJ953_19620 [Saprospiraceae bacterium]|nr:hypothetical protein [Saprospiraceae bacterium]